MNSKISSSPIFLLPVGEALLVLSLVLAWVHPQTIDFIKPGFVASLPLLFAAEFILGHAAVGFSAPFIVSGILRVFFSLFIIALYGGFFYFLCRAGQVLQVAIFLLVTISRIMRAHSNMPKLENNMLSRAELFKRLAFPPFLRVIFLMICLFLTMWIPLPELGLEGYKGMPGGSGHFAEYPQNLILLLIVYFSLIFPAEKKVFPVIEKMFS